MRPTSPLAYLAAFLLVIGGWMAGTIVAAGAWDQVREAPTQGLQDALAAGGESVAVFTDVLQPEREIVCTARPAGEKEAEPAPLDPAPVDLRVARDGSTWHLLAFAPEVDGEVVVRCAPQDDNGDAAGYQVAAVEGVLARARLGNLIVWTATAAGIALAGWTWWNRRRTSRES